MGKSQSLKRQAAAAKRAATIARKKLQKQHTEAIREAVADYCNYSMASVYNSKWGESKVVKALPYGELVDYALEAVRFLDDCDWHDLELKNEGLIWLMRPGPGTHNQSRAVRMLDTCVGNAEYH